MQERPFDLLNKAIGGQVLIRLKNGTDIRGKMTAFDIHMNVVLDSAEELGDGVVKTKVGTILLRGGNILWVSPA